MPNEILNKPKSPQREGSTLPTSQHDTDHQQDFNARQLWPDIIKCPKNEWTFAYADIVKRLGDDEGQRQETKKKMEKCLMYFHKLRKEMKLFDHTYTACCILFYRYWYTYDLPPTLPQCIHLSQAILVTACKTMENNRPTDHYIKATCDFMVKDGTALSGQKLNLEKLKWEVRDQLVVHEKKVLCRLGFDLAIENPKELIEEIFSGYHRYMRDKDIDPKFGECFPAILQEARNFIIQTGTQPISLLCDGYTLVAAALLFAGVRYNKEKDSHFKFTHNFFRERFPVVVTGDIIASLFFGFKVLEKEFFDLKSNKGEALSITSADLEKILDEDAQLKSEPFNPYDYEHLKDGEVDDELIKYTERKIDELSNRIISERSSKRPSDLAPNATPKKQRIQSGL